jgi:hypothetical protein
MSLAKRLEAPGPKIDGRTSDMSPLLTPFKYRIGIRLSALVTV